MASILKSLREIRTSIPGAGLVLVALGHWWTTGHFSTDDLMAILGGAGLISAADSK